MKNSKADLVRGWLERGRNKAVISSWLLVLGCEGVPW